jgi:hypothetical protein
MRLGGLVLKLSIVGSLQGGAIVGDQSLEVSVR